MNHKKKQEEEEEEERMEVVVKPGLELSLNMRSMELRKTGRNKRPGHARL